MATENVRVTLVLAMVGVLLLPHVACAQDVRSAIEQLSTQLAKGAPEGRQLRLAVTDFPDLQGVTSELGRFIASRLTTRLAQSPKFFIVERQRLNQVLTELKFSMSDLVDPSKARQLGKMAGVEAIVVGSISDFGNQVDVDARIIEIETNRMLFGTSVTIGKDPSVVAMLERGRQEPGRREPSPIEPDGPKHLQGQTLRGIRFSDKFVSLELDGIEIAGDEIKFLFVYANRRQSDSSAGVANGRDLNANYIVDDRGARYGYTGDSLGGQHRNFSPNVPERIWVTFKKPQPGSSAVTLRMWWSAAETYVLIRNIPLNR